MGLRLKSLLGKRYIQTEIESPNNLFSSRSDTHGICECRQTVIHNEI